MTNRVQYPFITHCGIDINEFLDIEVIIVSLFFFEVETTGYHFSFDEI